MTKRPRKRKLQVPVRPIGLERSGERFPSRRRPHQSYHNDSEAPKINTWRENITVLSQVHNIYFIAIVDEVWVYQPSFPLQKLGKDPILKIRLPQSAPNLTGYIDLQCPHSVNHLLVTFLGIEEILLVTCDDGDVIGFRIEEIQQAIERRLDPDSPENVYTDVRHFLNENVGMSAWGLAVHTEARKIAVSANTHEITVFEYALASGQTENEENELATEAMRTSRKQDRRYNLAGQLENIPCVTFCNTGDDPEGRFLACGDITGLTYIWDLRHRKMIEVNKLEFCTASSHDHRCVCATNISRHFPHSVWGLAWLSRAAFRKYPPPVNDILGCDGKSTSPDESAIFTHLSSKPLDFSAMRSSVRHSAPLFVPAQLRNGPAAPTSNASQIGEAILSELSSEPEDDEMEDFPDVSELQEDEDLGEEQHADTIDVDQLEDDHLEELAEELAVSPELEGADDAEGSEDESASEQAELEEVSEPTVEVVVSHRGQYHRKHVPQYLRDVKEPSLLAEDKFPQSPFLHLAMYDILLMQPRGAENRPYPIIGVHEPFQQHIEVHGFGTSDVFSQSEWAEHCDRISLHTIIPELGVVVIATPKGRAAVLALFQTYNKKLRRPVYVSRMEWLLPTAEQENNAERPETKLIGLAASPIQGMLGEREQGRPRKWRLLMTYVDHSVLSYEIRRAEEETQDETSRKTKVDSRSDFFP